MPILLVVAIWFAVSIPVSLLVGTVLGHGSEPPVRLQPAVVPDRRRPSRAPLP